MNNKKELTQEEIKELEKLFKYSFIMYESDILRFKFDIGQFKPNTAYEIKFIDLIPLYNEWYYKYSRVFLNLMKKTFVVIKAQGREDTFLLLLTDSETGAKRIKDLSKMKSFKYKANFTRKERSLLYGLKNGFNEYYRYSWNFTYLEDMEIQMEEIEQEIEELKIVFDEREERANHLKNIKRLYLQCDKNEFNKICEEIDELQYKIFSLEKKLISLNKNYNKFKYGGEPEKTIIDDYYFKE